MSLGRALLIMGGLAVAGPAMAQPAPQPGAPAGMPLKDLLNDGYEVASMSANGNSGEVVLILNKEKKHFACVMSGLRGEVYGQGPARPSFPPCTPLN